MPSITGKLELEYEGELQGPEQVARELIRRAAGAVLDERLGHIDLSGVVEWFDRGGALKVAGDQTTAACLKGFGVVPGLLDAVVAGELAARDQARRTSWAVRHSLSAGR